MTTPICVTLSGILSGTTQQGALTPVPLAYTLDAQTGHQQFSGTVEVGETKVVTLPTNLAGPNATLAPLSLLFITIDVAGIAIRLNSAGTPVGPFQFPKPAGPLVLPGEINSPAGPVSDIEFVNGGSQRATFSVTAIYGN